MDANTNFWEEKTLDQLAAGQGVPPTLRFEDILGAGAELWKDALDLEEFLRGIYQRRREERDAQAGEAVGIVASP
jgi:hypothetical protein